MVLRLKVDVDVCGFGFRVFGKHRVWLQGFEKGLSVISRYTGFVKRSF